MTWTPTIALTPKAIRKAFVARLIAKNVAGGNIVSTRGDEFGPDDVPAVNVMSLGSDSDSRSHGLHFDRTERIICAGTVAVARGQSFATMDEAVGDEMDDLEAAIVSAIMTWRELTHTIKAWQGKSVRKGFNTKGEDLRAFATVEFRFLLDEAYEQEAPLAADGKLNTVDAEVDIGGAGTPGYNVQETGLNP